MTHAGTGKNSPRDLLQAMLDRAVVEYSNNGHPHGCFVNSEPLLVGERAHNRAPTTQIMQETSDNEQDEGSLAALAAFTQVLLAGLVVYTRDGAYENQLQRVAENAGQAIPS